ncbi:MAG: alpha/beta hydrolase [Chromatocurvus sp.]
MIWLILTVIALVWFSVSYLRGENLGYLDRPPSPSPQAAPSDAHHAVVEQLREFAGVAENDSGQGRIKTIRDLMDAIPSGKSYASVFTPVQRNGVKGEWVQAPGVNTRRRVLYIHGGAWFAGSPLSHRPVTDKLSLTLDAAVFSLDYRLLPEYRRADGIFDCRQAYRWILHNGPEDAEPPDFLLVAGDSAGGSLTLDVIAWARDSGLRRPDAAVALSPSTDATMTSPSLHDNIETDPMLGPAFAKLLKLPTPLLWWFYWFSWRIPPSDPRVSPLRGNLEGLSPVLILASEAEMLIDDARRYAAKAQAAGSPVQLQTWPHMVHVWPMFTPELPEAEEAYANIAEFVAALEPPAQGQAVTA